MPQKILVCSSQLNILMGQVLAINLDGFDFIYVIKNVIVYDTELTIIGLEFV